MKAARGSILLVALFAMTILSLVALSMAYRAGVSIRSVRQTAILAKLKAHSESATAIALARLRDSTNEFDHPAEPWHTHAPLSSEDWLDEWQQGTGQDSPQFVTTYQVIDENGKLHVLFASSEAIETLGASPDQIAGLFDWMDTDSLVRADGAESEYYLSLHQPYRCKNANLQLLDELLLIRGFARADYLGEDANHNGVLDSNENDGGLSYPPDDADGTLRLGWVDLLTARGDGRVDLNTAPRLVLETLPISEQAVSQIIGYRTFDQNSSGDLADHAFTSVTDIEQLQGLTQIERDTLATLARFKSSDFRVFVQSVHLLSGTRYDVQVLVRMSDEGPEILQWKAGS